MLNSMAKKIAVGYVRVSTEIQAEEGVSLGQQRNKIRAYCDALDLELIHVFADEGISAKSMDRPGLLEAIACLNTGRAGVLIITKLDRLTRSIKDLSHLMETTFSKHELISIGDNIDTRTATGRLILNILGSVAQWEREKTVELVTETIHTIAREEGGWHWGTAAYGYRFQGRDAKGRLLTVPLEEEQITIRLIRRLAVEEKMSLSQICRGIEAAGIPNRAGRVKWQIHAVHVICRREGIPLARATNNQKGRPRAPGSRLKHLHPFSPWPSAPPPAPPRAP